MPLSYTRGLIAYAGLRLGEVSSGKRVRLFGVGTAKSGTHSIASMFRKPVRAKHEPERKQLVPTIVDVGMGRLHGEDLRAWVRARDRRLRLQVDAANMYFFLLDPFLEEFPDAKFVLTIRDCYSWLNSVMRHGLRFADPKPMWAAYRELLYKPHLHVHAPEERALKEKGLYTLDGYLSNWAEHNAAVLAKVPADKLLIVKTHEIGKRAAEIARFGGLPEQLVQSEAAHTFENPIKGNLLAEVPGDFLERKVEQHCRAVMARLFPEIRSAGDARL